jgi:hypothetical protein
MAYTVTLNKRTVWGDQIVREYYIVADAATQYINAGMVWIDTLMVSKGSGCSAWVVTKNALATGTAAAGYFAISGAASGDFAYVTCIGR